MKPKTSLPCDVRQELARPSPYLASFPTLIFQGTRETHFEMGTVY